MDLVVVQVNRLGRQGLRPSQRDGRTAAGTTRIVPDGAAEFQYLYLAEVDGIHVAEIARARGVAAGGLVEVGVVGGECGRRRGSQYAETSAPSGGRKLALAADNIAIATFGGSDAPKAPTTAVITHRLEGLDAGSEVTGGRGCRPGASVASVAIIALRRSMLRQGR